MGRLRLQPYAGYSRSCRALSEASGVLRVRVPGVRHRADHVVRTTRFRPREGDVVVNWGSSEPMFPSCFYFNQPRAVAVASNKLDSLEAMEAAGVTVPQFTTDIEEAAEWVSEGEIVVCRTLLRANSGRGIVLASSSLGPLVQAPLYTRYIPKYDEYRVHVWDGKVIDVQQKRRRRNEETEVDQRIRNAAGGWVFCRGDVEPDEEVTRQAVRAVGALGLDFAGVDVGWTRNTRRATVYECNTAPGVEGTTLEHYAANLRNLRERGA